MNILSIGDFKLKTDPTKCVSCFNGVPYCPVSAVVESYKPTIIEDECVDYGICIRAGVCPVDAIYYMETPWPRSIKAMFSGGARSFGTSFRDFFYITNKVTTPEMSYDDVKQGRVGGGSRGTSEMKTNDISGRFKDEDVGFALEFDRPGVGFRFHEIEKASMALASRGIAIG